MDTELNRRDGDLENRTRSAAMLFTPDAEKKRRSLDITTYPSPMGIEIQLLYSVLPFPKKADKYGGFLRPQA